ncbi:MAG: holin [Clostridia bacterium]|nr:holin [Clostridia bacterium]
MKKWIKAAGIRAVKTMAETALAVIGTNTFGITEVDWLGLLSACMLSGVITLLTCIKGLPEIKD